MVVGNSVDVVVRDVTIHTSPGMAVLAYNCTNVLLERVRNIPAPGGAPIAGNADAMHLSSCRGNVAVRGCVADRQGDDGLNVHSQYGLVQWAWKEDGATRMAVGPSANVDASGRCESRKPFLPSICSRILIGCFTPLAAESKHSTGDLSVRWSAACCFC